MEQLKVPLLMSRDCKYGSFRLEFVQSRPTFASDIFMFSLTSRRPAFSEGKKLFTLQF